MTNILSKNNHFASTTVCFLLYLVSFLSLLHLSQATCKSGDVCKKGWEDSDDDWHCSVCPQYYWCSGSSMTTNPCSPGTTTDGTNSCSCRDCVPGTYNPYSTHACMDCPAGTYQGSYGKTYCTPCAAGYYSSSGATSCTKSDTGWTNRGKSAPVVMSTYNGKFQPQGDTNSGDTMTAGYIGRFGFQIPCHGNTVSSAGASECTSCEDNRASDTHDTCLTTPLCNPGYYPVILTLDSSAYSTAVWFTTPSSYSCLPCPPGAWCTGIGPPRYGRWYIENAGASDVLVKNYMPEWRMSSPETANTSVNSNSEFTQIVTDNNTSYIDCTAAGLFLNLASYQCHYCPAGYRCPSGSNSAIHCDRSVGQYQPSTGQPTCITESDSDRWPFILMDATNIIKCNSGFYPDMVELTCKVCPAGFKCPDGKTYPIYCNEYTEYQSKAGQSSCDNCDLERYVSGDRMSCITCLPTHYYDFLQDECLVCPAGFYCQGRWATRCPEDTYAEKGATSCSVCEVEYTNSDGEVEIVPGYIPPARDRCVLCEPGYYVSIDLITCLPCPQGYACPDGVRRFSCGFTDIGTEDEPRPISTPTLYQDDIAQIECKECSYAVARNSTVCKYCGTGEHLDADGYCKPCPAGFYCVSGNTYACPVGSYSPGGSDRCEFCINGTTDIRRSKCTACSEGSFRDDGFTCSTCSAGMYCTGGYSYECPDKYYSDEGSSRCIECTYGIVSARKTTCSECDDGEYLNDDHTSCDACPAGYYCTKGQLNQCGSGTYSEGSAVSCTECKGFVDEDRTVCNAGVSGATWAFSNSYSRGEFWAVGAPYIAVFVIFVIVDSATRGCMFWPKDMVDPLKHKKDEQKEKDKASKKKGKKAVDRVLKAGSLDNLAQKKAQDKKKIKDKEKKLAEKAEDAYKKAIAHSIAEGGSAPQLGTTRGGAPASMRPPMRGTRSRRPTPRSIGAGVGRTRTPTLGNGRGAPNSTRGRA